MSEYGIGYAFSAAALGLVAALTLYWLGGRRGKWRRRFVGSAVLAGTNVGTILWFGMFSWWFLLPFPILAAAWSLPYGSDSFLTKLGLRLAYAVASVSAGLPYCLVIGGKAWWVLAYHLSVALASVILALKNPVHAPAEEGAVCLSLGAGFILYPFTAA